MGRSAVSVEATGRGALTATSREIAKRLGISERRVHGRAPDLGLVRPRIVLLPERLDATVEPVTIELAEAD